ncbi:uncharacterized protein LOC119640676 [Glossina fuscipes]|uniref:Uncharacterized protein LOC119640676 n=1 Tax=Glossina fuscipes TaxID=7396 RepID=A0A9C5ZES0_9MUSC|nr:uncharacterized protein LOC119640676 [Glossina fuscipes]
MLVLSKIDYALIIYGNSCKYNINILKPVYHQAVRASCYAFRTTPINNIIIETGLPTLENRLYELKAKIVPKKYAASAPLIMDDVMEKLWLHNDSDVEKIGKIDAGIDDKNEDDDDLDVKHDDNSSVVFTLSCCLSLLRGASLFLDVIVP